MEKISYLLMVLPLLQACVETGPNVNRSGEDILDLYQVIDTKRELPFRDTIYVPIYSDIYTQSRNIKFNLTATLSVRNTSLSDTIYLEDIDYYNSAGLRVRQYLEEEKTLLLTPMQSIEYVIEENDTEGGTGANFIINWGAKVGASTPIFQGVMVSTRGQQGISFITEGVSIRKNL